MVFTCFFNKFLKNNPSNSDCNKKILEQVVEIIYDNGNEKKELLLQEVLKNFKNKNPL